MLRDMCSVPKRSRACFGVEFLEFRVHFTDNFDIMGTDIRLEVIKCDNIGY